jgi:hypothetical protein
MEIVVDNMDLHLLNDTWTLYFHDPWSSDWTMSSYSRLGDVSSIEDIAGILPVVSPHLHQGIWFVFRESIFPCWDDPANIEGGCLSIKVLKTEAPEYFKTLLLRLLGEDILVDKKSMDVMKVNGISVSPKKNFCILKLWLGSPDLNKREQFELGNQYDGEVVYRSNRENIIGNQK